MKQHSRQRRRKQTTVVEDDLVFTLSDYEENRTPTTVTVEKLSADRRRVLREDADIRVQTTDTETPGTDTDLANDFIDLGDVDIAAARTGIKASGKGPAEESRKKRYISSDMPFKNWIPHRAEYLDELLRSEGRPSNDDTQWCLSCKDEIKRVAEYRCDDCLAVCDYKDQCIGCLLADHARSPFHRIQKWNGSYFEKVTMQSTGLFVQLGHPDGVRCANPISARSKMVVLHTNGIHPTTIKYCGCDRAGASGNNRQQLLRYRLYPATEQEPMTCSTFTLLETTHLQNVQSKSGIYDLYMALERMSDNTGLRPTRDCYKAFSRSIREWKYLKMLKRAGRAHDPSGVTGTKPGELAVMCPACPHPGINIPDGWETASESDRFLYQLHVSLDACFRVKRLAVSNESKDPIIDDGLAYFVENAPYQAEIAKYAGQKAMAPCTGLAALDHADTKFHNGYAATGIGACICGRHEFMLPNGVGDLQVGERFVNMDFIWCSALRHHPKIHSLTSYDIMCQWLMYLKERIAALPPEYRPFYMSALEELMWGIGKLHWYSHKPVGHSRYSMNFIPGAARTDGEGIERRWWVIQPITSSTKMMGPGSRQSTLNDQFGYMNWRNLVKLGDTLSRRYLDAYKHAAEQEADFHALSEATEPEVLEEWQNLAREWENDVSKPDPYITEEEGPSESAIRRKLAEDEEELVRTGKKIPLHDISSAAFLSIGLDLEDQQRHLLREAQKKDSVGIFESRTALTRRLLRFRDIQSVYMPIVPQLLTSSGAGEYIPQQTASASITTQLVENTCLLLPSDVLKLSRLNATDVDPTVISKKTKAREALLAGLVPGLVDQEIQLRGGHCNDAIDGLRTKIQMRSQILRFKRVNVRHQGPNTRTQGLLASLSGRIQQDADKYRAARDALISLTGGGEAWERELATRYCELKPEDIRAMEDDDPATAHRRKKRKTGPAEGTRQISWIWRGADRIEGLTAGLRVEWLKARARVLRWKEELRLLPEELRRSIAFMEWKAAQWDTRATVRQNIDPALASGLRAYAAEQAAICRGLALKFSAAWQRAKIIAARSSRSLSTDSTDIGGRQGPSAGSAMETEREEDEEGEQDESEDEDEDEEDEGKGASVQELQEDDIAYLELEEVLSSL